MSISVVAAMRSSRLALAVACALFPVVSVLAAEADEQATTLDTLTVIGERPSYRAGESRTATKTDTPALRTPQSVQIVPRAVLEDQNALTLTDAVRNVAGTGSDFGFNGGSLPLLLVRGFPTVSMSASGAVTSSFYYNGTKVQGLPVAIASIESVEVVKGPAGVLYGRAEPGGLINVVTRQPQAERAFGFSQTWGSHGLSRTALDLTGALDAQSAWRGRVTLSYDDNASSRDFVEDRLANLSASLAWVPDERTRATLSLDRSRQDYRVDYGMPAIGDRPARTDRDNQFNEGGPLSKQDNTVVRFDLSQTLTDRVSLNVHALALDQDGAQYDLLPTTFFSGQAGLAATGDIDRLFSYEPERERTLHQFNADLTARFDTGAVAHTVLAGVDSYRDRFDSVSTGFVFGPPINIYEPVYGQAPPLDLAGTPLFPQEGRTRWTGVYLQDQFSLGNGVELIAGVRHDRSSARYGAPGRAVNEQDFTTPRVGAVWQFAPRQSVYAQYQEGIAANNGRNLAGEALDSEQGELYEIGHKLEAFDGQLASTVALYQLTKQNISNYVPDSSGFFETLAIGEARARGVEWDVSGQLTSRLALVGSYAYTQTEVTRDATYLGKRLPNVPRHAGNVWLRYAPGARWSFGGGVFAQGQRVGDQADTFRLPGYARVDLMAAYRFTLGAARAQLQLNLNNVFDREYFSGSHQHVTDWIQPGAPRTLLANFRIDL
jgi:iron complex outermembrane receptor protein